MPDHGAHVKSQAKPIQTHLVSIGKKPLCYIPFYGNNCET